MSSSVFIPSSLEDTSHLAPGVAALASGLVQSAVEKQHQELWKSQGGYYGRILLSAERNGGNYVNER